MTDYAKLYQPMHDGGKYFPGYSLGAFIEPIKALVEAHSPARILDYGSGKGYQYLSRRYHERWGGPLPYCYDPGVRHLDVLPDGSFDGVISTDVMEHIDKPDIPATLAKIASLCASGGFVFLGISCRPTKKKLADGRDVHLTIEPPAWWIERIKAAIPKEIQTVAHWDIAGHFDCSDEPWNSWA